MGQVQGNAHSPGRLECRLPLGRRSKIGFNRQGDCIKADLKKPLRELNTQSLKRGYLQSRESQTAAGFYIEFDGKVTCGLTAGEGPLFWESMIGPSIFSCLSHDGQALSSFHTPRPGALADWKSLKVERSRGGRGPVIWDSPWKYWMDWLVSSRLPPLPGLWEPFLLEGVEWELMMPIEWVTTGCLSLPGRPGNISPTIVIRKKAFTRMII